MNSDSNTEFINLSSDCDSIILIDEKELLEEKLKKSITKLFKIYTLEKAIEKINAIISEVREKLLLESRTKPTESVAPLSDSVSCNYVPVNTASIVTEFEGRPERETRTNSKNHSLTNMSRQKEIKKRKEKEKRGLEDNISGPSKEADACIPPSKTPNLRHIRMSAGADSHKIEEYIRLRDEGKLLVRRGALEEALKRYESAKEIFPTPVVLRRIEKLKLVLSRNVSNISDENQDSVENEKSSGSVEQSASQGSLPHDSELHRQSNTSHQKGLKKRTNSSCRWGKENHPSCGSNHPSTSSEGRKRKKKPQSSSIAEPMDTVPRNKKTKRARVIKEKANSSKNPELCKCPFNCSANISRLTEIEKQLEKLTERKKTLKEKRKRQKAARKKKKEGLKDRSNNPSS